MMWRYQRHQQTCLAATPQLRVLNRAGKVTFSRWCERPKNPKMSDISFPKRNVVEESVLSPRIPQYGSVAKPCTPVVHIKIAGKWMFIPLKMVLICINRYWSIPICLTLSNHQACAANLAWRASGAVVEVNCCGCGMMWAMGILQDPIDGGTLVPYCLTIFSGDIPWKIGLKNRPFFLLESVPSVNFIGSISSWPLILFSIIYGIVIPADFHMFQRGRYTTNQCTGNIFLQSQTRWILRSKSHQLVFVFAEFLGWPSYISRNLLRLRRENKSIFKIWVMMILIYQIDVCVDFSYGLEVFDINLIWKSINHRIGWWDNLQESG